MPLLELDAPQLGEYAWHAFTADTGIDAESRAHCDRIVQAVTIHHPTLDWRQARILELGAYRHYSGDLLASEQGSACFVTDIAPSALRDGRALARERGVGGTATPVVSDFHDLPFASDHFDVVFIASSVHHTRRPELVIDEMLRVLAPGGLLILANEPCARSFCFHAFSCNRVDGLTPWETAMNEAGLLPTLSSPFWGARPEHLFGMVENDRIPLSLYMESFARAGAVVERGLAQDTLVGTLERELMALSGNGTALQEQVRELLRSVVLSAASGFGATERLLDYRLPTECDIHVLAASVARLIERRPAEDEEWRAEMFGAALSVVVRKHGTRPEAVGSPFRRDMFIEDDGLVRERADASGPAAGLVTPLLPDLHASKDGAALDPWFPREDWDWYLAENGAGTLSNRVAPCRVEIGPRSTPALLLIRYFAVAEDAPPYYVRVWAGGRLLDEQLIVLQESRLVRARVPAGCAEILIDLNPADDSLMTVPGRIRMGVFQLFDAG